MILTIEIHSTAHRCDIFVNVPSHIPYAQRRIRSWATLSLPAQETDTATALLSAAVAALSHALADSDTRQDEVITVPTVAAA